MAGRSIIPCCIDIAWTPEGERYEVLMPPSWCSRQLAGASGCCVCETQLHGTKASEYAWIDGWMRRHWRPQCANERHGVVVTSASQSTSSPV